MAETRVRVVLVAVAMFSTAFTPVAIAGDEATAQPASTQQIGEPGESSSAGLRAPDETTKPAPETEQKKVPTEIVPVSGQASMIAIEGEEASESSPKIQAEMPAATTSSTGNEFRMTNAFPGNAPNCSQSPGWWLGKPVAWCGYLYISPGFGYNPDGSRVYLFGELRYLVVDACGNEVFSDRSWPATSYSYPSAGTYGWYIPSTVPSGPGVCPGTWTFTFSGWQQFPDGEQLSSSITTSFAVHASQAAAELATQTMPTGGPVGATEGLGGCSGSSYPSRTHVTGYPVDTMSGNFWHTFDDLSIPGRGPAIELSRTYNSALSEVSGPFGFGWNSPYTMSLTLGPSVVTVNQEAGAQASFTLSNGVWTTPPRTFATLVQNGDGSWTYTCGDRDIYDFDGIGRLTAIRDLNGYATTISYPSASSWIITDPAGRTLTFTLSNGRVASVADSSSPARTLSYSYDASGNLTNAVDVGGGRWQFTYDALHRMLTMRSPRFYGDTTTTPPPVVTNHYDDLGRIDWQSDPLGRTTTFDYTSVPGTTKMTDPQGDVDLFRYEHGLLTSITQGDGAQPATWYFRYDPDTLGRTTTIDSESHVTTAEFDSVGNIESSTDPLGRITSYTHNVLQQVTSITAPRKINDQPIIARFTYDDAGNPRTESAPLLNASGATTAMAVTTYHYDDPSRPGEVTSVTDANGHTVAYTYDSYGNLKSVTQPPTPENPAGNRTTYGYDAIRGWLTSTVSPRGNVAGADPEEHRTTYAHDGHGRLTLTRAPLWIASKPNEHQIVRSFDADGNPASVIDGNSHTSSYVHDAADQLTEIRRPDNSVLRNEYWPNGLLRYQYDGATRRTSYGYNARGQQTSVTDPLDRATAMEYDGRGNLTTVTDPSQRTTTYGYDATSRLTSVTYSDGVTPNVSNIAYDDNGQRTAMTDGTGTSSWSWDSLGRLTSSTSGAGSTVGYGYDLGGRLTSITYPGSTGTVTRTYDDANRLTGVRDWATRLTGFGYDPDSNLVTRTYPNASKTTSTFDMASRLMGISHAPTATGAVPFAKFDYTRDGSNLLASVTSTGVPADNRTWTHTPLDQVKTVNTSSYDYDPADNLIKRLDGSMQTFDAANQLVTTGALPIALIGTASGGNSTTNSLTLPMPTGSGLNDQILVAVTLPNNKNVTTPSGHTVVGTYKSGNGGTAAKIVVYRRTAAATNPSVVLSFSATFAKSAVLAVYRGVSPTSPVEAVSNGATASGTSVAAPGMNVSMRGERLVMFTGANGVAGTWTAPAEMTMQRQQAGGTTDTGVADQALTTPGWTGGRLANHSTSTALAGVLVALKPDGASYTYDLQGNRTGVTSATAGAVSHGYDQANRLTTYGSAATYAYNGDGLRTSRTASGSTTQFTWDNTGPAPSLLREGTTSYIYGPGDLPLARIDSTGAVLYYHQDQLGSTRALTSSSGAVVATYSYDPFGNTTGTTGTATNPLRFAGQYADAESGYQYLRARHYDSATGQFLTRDPIAMVTRQPYAYANNNPVTLSDPTGLGPLDVLENVACELAGFADTVGTWSGRIGVGLAVGTLFFSTPVGWGIGLGVLSTGASATQWVAGAVANDQSHVTEGLVGTMTGIVTFGTWSAIGSEGVEVSARASAAFGVYSSASRQGLDEVLNVANLSRSGCESEC